MTPHARAHTTRPRVVMVSTRALDGEPMAGRLRVVHAIRSSLADVTDLSIIRLPSMLTDKSVRRFWECFLAWIASVLRGSPLPFQCALFAAASDHRAILAKIPADCETLYADGVRSYSLIKYLRKHRPNLRIVLDLDDLMSRRMSLLLSASQPLSPGYLMRRLPTPVLKLAMSPLIGQLIVRYERKTLRAVECEIAPQVDRVVLLSHEDAKVLIEQGGPELCDVVSVIPPPSATVSDPIKPRKPVRFVFIGSDAQTQNRLTIDYLIDLWKRRNLTAELVFFGLWMRDIALPPHVRSVGYVQNLADVYDGSSVMLTPSLIAGGVKTKVLEAFAHGVAVIGSTITFESMDVGDYPLRIDDEAELLSLLSDPDGQAERFQKAAEAGADYIRRVHSPERFSDRWRDIMIPGWTPDETHVDTAP